METETKIKDEEYAAQMAAFGESGDIEMVHSKADDLLCEILKELGYVKLVEEFDKLDKWYA